MKPTALWLALAMTTASASAAPALEYAEAKRLAEQDEGSLPGASKINLAAAQRELVDAGIAARATPNPDFSAFVVVMEGHKQREVLRRALHLLRDLKHGNRG
jgi:hypothetical protein